MYADFWDRNFYDVTNPSSRSISKGQGRVQRSSSGQVHVKFSDSKCTRIFRNTTFMTSLTLVKISFFLDQT